jgi:biopolymer transport protein TolQ
MFQTSTVELVGSLGLVSKSVLVLLFLFSVISWAVIFFKWRVFRAADQGDQRFMALLAKSKDLGDVYRQI